MKVPVFKSEQDGPNVGAAWSASEVLKGLPTLSEFLCCPTWDGGVQRGERSLMTFVKAASVTAILKVEHPALKLVVAGPSFDEALAALEASLRLPEAPWQMDDNPLGRGGKKKK